jgi:hypothetical protein
VEGGIPKFQTQNVTSAISPSPMPSILRMRDETNVPFYVLASGRIIQADCSMGGKCRNCGVVLPPFHGTNFSSSTDSVSDTNQKCAMSLLQKGMQELVLGAVARTDSNIKLKCCYACNNSDISAEAQICCSLQVATDDGVFMLFTHRPVAWIASACESVKNRNEQVEGKPEQFWNNLLASLGNLSILPEEYLQRVCGGVENIRRSQNSPRFTVMECVELVHYHIRAMISAKLTNLEFEAIYFKEYDPSQDRYLGIALI